MEFHSLAFCRMGFSMQLDPKQPNHRTCRVESKGGKYLIE